MPIMLKLYQNILEQSSQVSLYLQNFNIFRKLAVNIHIISAKTKKIINNNVQFSGIISVGVLVKGVVNCDE